MELITARNIALISPGSTGFAALSGASSFAAQIIEKYSDTDMFPFSDEALVFLKNISEKIGDEKKVKENVNYTLKLMIIQRLILDGKIPDPTVTKVFLPSVTRQIENNLSFLKKNEFKAFKDVNEALTYITNAGDFSENIVFSEAPDGAQTFRYSSLDLTKLGQHINETASENSFFTENYAYNNLPAIIFRKEKIADNPELLQSEKDSDKSEAAPTVVNIENKTENALSQSQKLNEVTEINNAGEVSQTNEEETVINVGDTEYNYENEELTFKKEGDSFERSEVKNNLTHTEITNNAALSVTNLSETQNAENVTNVNNESVSESELSKIDVRNVGLMTMNSFMSGGSAYIYEIGNKYIHKRISLNHAAISEKTNLLTLLSEPKTAFTTINQGINMLISDGELSPSEKVIYDSSVKRVFLEHHSDSGIADTKEMFSKMDINERTEVLSLVVKRLSRVASRAKSAPKPADKPKVTKEEKAFIKTLTEKMSPQVLETIKTYAKGGTISTQLLRLYADESEEGNTALESNEYMPTLMKYIASDSYNNMYNNTVNGEGQAAPEVQNVNELQEYNTASASTVYNNNQANSYYNSSSEYGAYGSAPMNNYSVNTTIHNYALPPILKIDGEAEQGEDTYFNLTLPEKRHAAVVNAIRNLTKSVMNSEVQTSVNLGSQTNTDNTYISSFGAPEMSSEYNANYNYFDGSAYAQLNYREPLPSMDYAQGASVAATPEEPDMDELVKRFGNLIEGADAGLTPSFNVGKRGIGEAMAVIEETAEKVAVNSKLIEDIRERQEKIESDSLKSSDIDSLSEEMIKRLRTRIRYDKSRFPR